MEILNLLLADENKEVSAFAKNVVPVLKIVIACVIALCAIFMIIAVVSQKGESNGITGVTGNADTFYNRNKGASLQGKIKKLTAIDAAVLLVLCIAFLILNIIYGGF
ncbi:MAG: preprotein translocase subunit SecG [bacterium]|nr:preprotein translocase subunit SecG [bacterium]